MFNLVGATKTIVRQGQKIKNLEKMIEYKDQVINRQMLEINELQLKNFKLQECEGKLHRIEALMKINLNGSLDNFRNAIKSILRGE